MGKVVQIYRNEKKYMMADHEAHWAFRMFLNWMDIDSNSDDEGKYKVRSLYFDDAKKTSYYEKREGFYYRKKYRARVYFKSESDIPTPVKLECKRRAGHKITKKSNIITKGEFNHIVDGSVFSSSGEGVLGDFLDDSSNYRLYPGVIVDYDRIALVDRHYNLRITIDSNLCAGWSPKDFFSKKMLSVPVLEKNNVILEIKYRDFVPEHIMSILKNTRIHPQSFSKFYVCMNNGYGQIIKEKL